MPGKGTQIRIVPMAMEHIDAVAALERECFSSPWSRRGLTEELSNPLAVFNVAMAGEEVAGYAGMHHVVDEGYIANICTAEKYRRMGVAAALLDAYFDYARNHGMTLLTLEVRVSNLPALSLYERYGFKSAGLRKDYYRDPTEDALILEYCGFTDMT